jgi:hypothetical protein
MLKSRIALLAAFALALSFAGAARAADDATGTWKYQVKRGDQTADITLKLKQDGEKLTGSITGGRDNTATDISDGTVKDGQVSFKVTRKRGDKEFTMTYTGKVEGDTLKGKSTGTFNGQERSREFEAKRSKE